MKEATNHIRLPASVRRQRLITWVRYQRDVVCAHHWDAARAIEREVLKPLRDGARLPTFQEARVHVEHLRAIFTDKDLTFDAILRELNNA